MTTGSWQSSITQELVVKGHSAICSVKLKCSKTNTLKMARSRSWCFTLNNYTEDERDSTRALSAVYVVFGYERGEEGTPHLQGYAQFASKKSHKQMKAMLPRAHWEVRKGTIAEAVDYCKKDGDYEEIGKKPLTPEEKGDCNKKRWRLINEKAIEGDEEWLKENEPHVYHTGLATFRSHKKARTEVLGYSDVDTPHEWWVGPTGTGKSKALHEEYPGHYQKEKNKWWCNYRDQDVVAIEEADPKTMEHMASRMKQWADRYPFPGEIKGGRLEGIRPKKVIVTSNYDIRECFPNPNDYEPLERRFKVRRFEPLGPPPAIHPLYTIL